MKPGVYELEVRAYDLYDNFCFATLAVTVLEPPPATTTITTIMTTTTTEPGGPDPLLMFGIGGGMGAVAVLVIIFIFMKRKPRLAGSFLRAKPVLFTYVLRKTQIVLFACIGI